VRPSRANVPLDEVARRLSKHLAKRRDLLQLKYRSLVEAGAHPLTGHCYVAAEALYHMGAKGEGYRPHVLSLPDGGTHWYLKDGQGRVLDPTAAQFAEPPDYAAGTCKGFLTKRPSRRARSVLRSFKYRGPKVDRTSPLTRRILGQLAWLAAVRKRLSPEGSEYARSPDGLEHLERLHRRRTPPARTAKLMELRQAAQDGPGGHGQAGPPG